MMDLDELARALAGHPAWTGAGIPTLIDDRTKGALLGMVRELWRDPFAHTHPSIYGSLVGPARYRWCCKTAAPQTEPGQPIRPRLVDHIHDDEGGALAMAWLDGMTRFRSSPSPRGS